MNELEREIKERIALEGPLSIADFMSLCLTHPKHGYYTTSSPLGGSAESGVTGGDFITAPEVSQLFGEMIGVWAMEVWQKLGEPSKFNLVEVGPGRGTLMRDLLNISRALPAFRDAARVHLIEASPSLASIQQTTLAGLAVTEWHKDIDTLPDAPTIFIANELLDALPFRQWVKVNQDWHGRAVGVVKDRLEFVVRPNKLSKNDLPTQHKEEPEGSIFENAPAREGFVDRVTEHILKNTGAALFIDYGHRSSGFGDTFQAVRDHHYAPLLDAPGKADLTNHVDFEPLLTLCRKAGCFAPDVITQQAFLCNLGLLERAGALGHGKSPDTQKQLQNAVNRLVGPTEMGDLFKVLAFAHSPYFHIKPHEDGQTDDLNLGKGSIPAMPGFGQ